MQLFSVRLTLPLPTRSAL
ncbi:CRISPR-associated protein Cas5 [Pseudomonas syringae]|nr:CRISPR-associated protein Cas5 [Pseudomonas syringae]